MKVVILAAGMGTRLRPLTNNIPKSLLNIGGKTLLDNQITAIRDCNIKNVLIVTGYLSHKIENYIEKYHNDINIEIVYNPFYEITNNLISFWLALKHIDGDFILVNGDDLFKSDVLRKLKEADGNIVMVIDRKKTYSEEDMKVVTKNNKVIKVSKRIPLDEANGESIGMIKFSGDGVNKIKEKLDKMVRLKENHNVFYLQALQELMDDGYEIKYVEIPEDHWAEIDVHTDLDFVKSRIRENLKKINIF